MDLDYETCNSKKFKVEEFKIAWFLQKNSKKVIYKKFIFFVFGKII